MCEGKRFAKAILRALENLWIKENSLDLLSFKKPMSESSTLSELIGWSCWIRSGTARERFLIPCWGFDLWATWVCVAINDHRAVRSGRDAGFIASYHSGLRCKTADARRSERHTASHTVCAAEHFWVRIRLGAQEMMSISISSLGFDSLWFALIRFVELRDCLWLSAALMQRWWVLSD